MLDLIISLFKILLLSNWKLKRNIQAHIKDIASRAWTKLKGIIKSHVKVGLILLYFKAQSSHSRGFFCEYTNGRRVIARASRLVQSVCFEALSSQYIEIGEPAWGGCSLRFKTFLCRQQLEIRHTRLRLRRSKTCRHIRNHETMEDLHDETKFRAWHVEKIVETSDCYGYKVVHPS